MKDHSQTENDIKLGPSSDEVIKGKWQHKIIRKREQTLEESGLRIRKHGNI
jgi:hypothetical protein